MVISLSRRRFLRLVGIGGGVLAGQGLLASCLPSPEPVASDAPAVVAPDTPVAPAGDPREGGVALAPTPSNAAEADLAITLAAREARVPLFPGGDTTVWRYDATVTQGDPASVQALPNSYLGPILRVRRGQRVRVTFENDLPQRDQVSIIHWHGLHLSEEMDGHPRYAVGPGQSYLYDFTVTDRAATYWFHPHPDMLTGPQVYMGLAGLFIVSDDEESQLGLPAGDQDLPLVIQDRTFDSRNQLVYLDGGQGGMGGGMGGMGGMGRGMGGMGAMMGRMMGFLGEQILVNGRPDFVLDTATRAYRLRLLNGSNSRIYKLAWSDGAPLVVIGTDGGLLAAPVERRYVMLAPGERVELWADWSAQRVGDEIALESLGFEGAESEGMPMMGMSSGPPLGTPMTLMKVRITRQEQETLALPSSLTPIVPHRLEDAVNRDAPRQFVITLQGMQWLINGRSFAMDDVAQDERVALDTTEVWEFVNVRNPGHPMDPDGMAHPFHIHGVQFNVIERQVLPELRSGYDTVREGYVDEGWKDTVMVMAGERVKVLLRFADFTGDFVYHCHNLEHEDNGMMRNYRIENIRAV